MIYLITLIALIIITAVLYFKGSEFANPISVICIIGFFIFTVGGLLLNPINCNIELNTFSSIIAERDGLMNPIEGTRDENDITLINYKILEYNEQLELWQLQNENNFLNGWFIPNDVNAYTPIKFTYDLEE